MAERTVAEILRAAKARIEAPEHWCRGQNARSAKGRPVKEWSPRATQWCAVGAIFAEQPQVQASPGEEFHAARMTLNHASVRLCGRASSSANDAFGHEVVMAIYDEAIRMAEEV
jgi:hypothetical protein